ncbi:MAG: hypothetical protein ACKOI0_07175, partial [Actinomycetota bacterium]
PIARVLKRRLLAAAARVRSRAAWRDGAGVERARERGGLPIYAGQPPTLPGAFDPCAFAPRCPRADARCRSEEPSLQDAGDRLVACHHPLAEVAAR